MSSAIVVGATSLIGFQLCQTLISKEYDVLAVDPIKERTESEEEKLMEIGRNAFFQYALMQEVQWNIDKEEYDVLFICTEKEWTEEEVKQINHLSNYVQKVIVTCSSLQHNNRTLTNSKEKYITVVTPELFGPWDLESSPIQQAILQRVGRNDEQQQELQIKRKDYLYIENLSEALVALWEEKVSEETLFVTNPEKNSWEIISQELNIPVIEVDNWLNGDDKIIWDFISYKPTITVEEGLHLQKRFVMIKLRSKRIIE
ncbi:hypothetical protein ACWE42_18860 [Sutcliffiella cohnii]